MAVHYKLKSSRKFESVFFEGHEITGRELKAEIAAKQDLGADAIAELTLTNPKTGEEYDDARGIPRNSSVLVTRKPPVRFPALQAASTATAADAAHAGPPSSAAPEAVAEEGDEFGEAYSEQPQAAVLPDEDIAQALASQQQSWQAGLAAGGRGGRGGRGAGGRGGRGPGGFAALPQRPDDRPCPRCGQPGHRQQDCPTRDNPEFDVKRVHMPRGIPTSLLKASVAGEGSMVLPDGKIGTLRANEAAFLREMQASRTALAARAAPTALPATGSAQPTTAAALPAPAVSTAPAEPLLLTQKPYDGATADSVPASAVPASAAPVAASALAAVPQFAGASEYLPETLPVTAPSLNGGMPSLGGGLPGALGVMPALFPPLLRPGLGPGQLPGVLPLGALVAGEKPLSFEEFNRLKALAAAKQQPAPLPQAPRSKVRSHSHSPPSRQRSSKDKDGKRRSSSKRQERSASRSPGRRHSPYEKRPRKHHSEKESSSRHRHHSSSARHREAEPVQAVGVAVAPAGVRHKASGVNEGLGSQNSNGHHGARDPLSAVAPSRKVRSQLPPLTFPGSREHGPLRPSYPAQQQQQPRPLQNAPYQGRGYARSGRDVTSSSHDRRIADRDAAKLSKRRSKPSSDDRWEEYSASVAAPPRVSPESIPPAKELPGDAAKAHSHAARSQKLDDSHYEAAQAAEEPPARDAAVPRTDGPNDNRRVQLPAGPSVSTLPASPLRSGDGGQDASQPPAQRAAEVPSPDRSGSHGPLGPEEPPRVAVIEVAEEKVQPVEVQGDASAERDETKREKKKKHKKQKDKKHKHRDDEAVKACSPPKPAAGEPADAPTEEQEPSPASREEAASQDAKPEQERLQPKIVLQRNPPMVGKQLAQQRAAAMRSAVQEDEDALASGAPSRGAVAALAPARRPASSLWARAVSGLTADAQPHRQSILQRLSKPLVAEPPQQAEPQPTAKAQYDVTPTTGSDRDRDGGRSPRKRCRRDAKVDEAEGHERERGEKVKKHKKKHRSD